jgi:plasmid maintenance system antidote protein VapI
MSTPEEITKLTQEEMSLAQDVALLGAKHLQIEQLVIQRNNLTTEIEKIVSETKKISKELIRRMGKLKEQK